MSATIWGLPGYLASGSIMAMLSGAPLTPLPNSCSPPLLYVSSMVAITEYICQLASLRTLTQQHHRKLDYSEVASILMVRIASSTFSVNQLISSLSFSFTNNSLRRLNRLYKILR